MSRINCVQIEGLYYTPNILQKQAKLHQKQWFPQEMVVLEIFLGLLFLCYKQHTERYITCFVYIKDK